MGRGGVGSHSGEGRPGIPGGEDRTVLWRWRRPELRASARRPISGARATRAKSPDARKPAHSESARSSPSTARRRAGFEPHAECGRQRLAGTFEQQQEGRAEQPSPVRILVGPDDPTLARWTRGFGKAREAAVPLRAGLVVLERQQGFQGEHGTGAIGAVSFVPEQRPECVPGRRRDQVERALGNVWPGEAGAVGCNGQAEPLVPEAIAPRERTPGEVARRRR